MITGENMSGKSTFLKQCGLLQIMSQMGCFIPATRGNFTIKKNILSLCGDYSEDLQSKSSFEREMSEINYILKNLNSSSLILIDELCRSTNYYEGLSIAMAACEYIMQYLNNDPFGENKNITVLFATHFKELAHLEHFFPKLHTFQMKSTEEIHTTASTYKLVEGVCQNKEYGLRIAESVGFPKKVIDYSKETALDIEKSFNGLFDKKQSYVRRKLIFKLVDDLNTIAKKANNMSDIELISIMDSLRDEFEENYINNQ